MDEVVNLARKAAETVEGLFKSVATVIRVACAPPRRSKLADGQMTINYKAVAISIILLFLARALEGHMVNEIAGSAIVVGLLVALIVALKFVSDMLSGLARALGIGDAKANASDASAQWFTLLVSMWAFSLFIVVLHDLAHIYLQMPHWGLFFGSDLVLAVFAAALSLGLVCMKTRLIDGGDLGSAREIVFYSFFSITLIATALHITVFLHWR